jgi:uncharacterized protein YkwD
MNRRPIENLVHAHVNQVREQHGLSYLTQDDDLRNIARRHSADMADRQFFAHVNSDGKDPGDRYDDYGYSHTKYGENIARVPYQTPLANVNGQTQYDTPPELARGIVDGWINSEGHRENMLSTKWDCEGIGIEIERKQGVIRVYTTQNFS